MIDILSVNINPKTVKVNGSAVISVTLNTLHSHAELKKLTHGTLANYSHKRLSGGGY